MYYRLITSSVGSIRVPDNLFIYDTSDKSVEFVTLKEREILDRNGITISLGRIEPDEVGGTMLAKIALSCSGNYELFNNGSIKFDIKYDYEKSFWYLVIYLLDKKIIKVRKSDFLWSFNDSEFISGKAEIPSYYASQLVVDKQVRIHELAKILNCTSVGLIDSDNEYRKIKGTKLVEGDILKCITG